MYHVVRKQSQHGVARPSAQGITRLKPRVGSYIFIRRLDCGQRCLSHLELLTEPWSLLFQV